MVDYSVCCVAVTGGHEFVAEVRDSLFIKIAFETSEGSFKFILGCYHTAGDKVLVGVIEITLCDVFFQIVCVEEHRTGEERVLKDY